MIVLNRIHFNQNIRSTSELKLPPVSDTKSKEMDMADKLIEQLTEKFNISKYKDTYTEKLLKIIEDKSKGKKKIGTQSKKASKQSGDLMSMLKASLESRKQKTS